MLPWSTRVLATRIRHSCWLDKAIAERCEYLVYLPTEPWQTHSAATPGSAALLQRLGLKK